jgi:hypothetical protein
MGKQCVRIWETLNTYPLFAFLSRVKMRATALTKTRAAFSEVKTVCEINAESVSRGMGNQSSLDMVNGKAPHLRAVRLHGRFAGCFRGERGIRPRGDLIGGFAPHQLGERRQRRRSLSLFPHLAPLQQNLDFFAKHVLVHPRRERREGFVWTNRKNTELHRVLFVQVAGFAAFGAEQFREQQIRGERHAVHRFFRGVAQRTNRVRLRNRLRGTLTINKRKCQFCVGKQGGGIWEIMHVPRNTRFRPSRAR